MVEIYWLQRLANIGFVFNIGMWICIILLLSATVTVVIAYLTDDDFDYEYLKGKKKIIKVSSLVFGFFILGAIFTPTEKDLMAIYGLGGTIDYIKSNDKAKELPDKVVDALTRYVDSIEKENKNNNDK